MLVLSREVDEAIRIGNDIEVVVVAIRNGKVRLGIKAPKDMRIDRQEVREAIERDGELHRKI